MKMAMEVILSIGLLFVGIAILVAIHICIVRRLFSGDRPNGVLGVDLVQRLSTSIPKISSEDLNSLPCFQHVGGGAKVAASMADCAICLESFRADEKCRSLPDCGHYFHAQCIDSWLLKTPICPICRTCIIIPRSCKVLVEEEGTVQS